MSEHGHHHHGGHSGHGAVQAGSGGDTNSLAQALGLGPGHNHGHNFLSHLLGLDHDHHAHGQHGQQMGWSSALQALKLSDAFQGINVTPNFLFILLFVGLLSWLYVIYWIRHHEPLANSVLGTAAAQSRTAAADRQLVAGIKYALPFRTSASTGDFYVPSPGAAQAEPQTAGLSSINPMPAPPVPPQPMPQPTPLGTSDLQLGAGGIAAYAPSFAQPGLAHNAYMVPVQAAAGTRVKMIVNR
jgi:hypothetical protein